MHAGVVVIPEYFCAPHMSAPLGHSHGIPDRPHSRAIFLASSLPFFRPSPSCLLSLLSPA